MISRATEETDVAEAPAEDEAVASAKDCADPVDEAEQDTETPSPETAVAVPSTNSVCGKSVEAAACAAPMARLVWDAPMLKPMDQFPSGSW